MSQHTSTFGQPTGPVPQPVEEPTTTSGNRRTVVLAVTGAVVALGVLGGAAALALTPEEDAGTLSAPVPAATPTVEPSTEPSAEPTTPLPTAVVQGRNIFVPLLDAPVESAGGGADEGSVAEGGGTSQLDMPPAPAPAPPAAPSAEVVALEAQVARLSADVAGLTAVLDAPDTLTGAETEQLRGRLSATEGELATVRSQLATAQATVDAQQFYSLVVSVDDPTVDDPTADFTVTLTDGGTSVVSHDVAIGHSTEDGRFTYVGYDADNAEVTFRYVSSLITVRVGANLTVPAGGL